MSFPVFFRYSPGSGRIGGKFLKAHGLFLIGDRQVDLDDYDAIDRELSFKISYLFCDFRNLFLEDQLVDAIIEKSAIPGPVEYSDAVAFGSTNPETPKIRPENGFIIRGVRRIDLESPGIEAEQQSVHQVALAGAVRSLKYYDGRDLGLDRLALKASEFLVEVRDLIFDLTFTAWVLRNRHCREPRRSAGYFQWFFEG